MSAVGGQDSFCSLPFVHICNRVDGKILACCHAKGVVTDDSGVPFDITKGATFEQAFRSSYMESLRNNLLQGVRDSRCQTCWKLEGQGVVSKRQHDGNRFVQQARERLKIGRAHV